tara:strand:+ start:6189 stop:6443 length:255 start_codon:yes stop_codon:yes gene_type:complete
VEIKSRFPDLSIKKTCSQSEKFAVTIEPLSVTSPVRETGNQNDATTRFCKIITVNGSGMSVVSPAITSEGGVNRWESTSAETRA